MNKLVNKWKKGLSSHTSSGLLCHRCFGVWHNTERLSHSPRVLELAGKAITVVSAKIQSLQRSNHLNENSPSSYLLHPQMLGFHLVQRPNPNLLLVHLQWLVHSNMLLLGPEKLGLSLKEETISNSHRGPGRASSMKSTCYSSSGVVFTRAIVLLLIWLLVLMY